MTMANLTVPGNSILTMPLPDTKAAPEKFKGRYTKVRAFIIHFELLLEQNNVTANKDKCELISRYCSRSVSEFIQALPSYTKKDWDALKEDILKYYDADLDNKRYTPNDLDKLVRDCRQKKIKNLSSWREYGRKFITIAGWLMKKERISTDEYSTYYWKGIPKVFRGKLESRLFAANPMRNLSRPFTVDEINSTAERLLQRDRFDAFIAGSDDEDSEDESSESSSDSDDVDDLKELRRKIKKRAKYSKKKGSDSDDEDSDDEPISRKKSFRENETRKISGRTEPQVETIINQLNRMSIHDPGYAGLVFRALKLDPDVLKFIRPPVFMTNDPAPNVPQFTQAAPSFPRQPPPHMMPNNYMSSQNFQTRPDGCFGCGELDHRIGRCDKLNDLVNRNVLTRDPRGRLMYATGAPIRRLPDEPLLTAVRREQSAKKGDDIVATAHLIRVLELSDDEEAEDEAQRAFFCDMEPSSAEEYGEEDQYDDFEEIISAAVFEDMEDVRFENAETYPALRTERRMTEKRREAMENVLPKKRKPPVKPETKNEKPVPEKRAPRNEPRDQQPAPKKTVEVQIPVPISKKPEVPRMEENRAKRSEPVPVDTRRPEFDGRRDDAIMEDLTNRFDRSARDQRSPAHNEKAPVPELTRKQQIGEKKPLNVRKSEVSSHVQPMNVLDQVLNTRIDLAIGEVLGISKDLSYLLGDKIKPKSMPPKSNPMPVAASLAASVPIATSFYSTTRGLLIQLFMQCDGRPITAIIDTGSQLNIVSKTICEELIKRPVDHTEKIGIGDANGGQGKLEGVVTNVPLNCGDVATTANLWVGTHVPFQLLLGRPWQRGNYVSIDERVNGTYLMFKDPKTLEPKYEILVVADKRTYKPLEVRNEFQTWNLSEPVTAYFTQITQVPGTDDDDEEREADTDESSEADESMEERSEVRKEPSSDRSSDSETSAYSDFQTRSLLPPAAPFPTLSGGHNSAFLHSSDYDIVIESPDGSICSPTASECNEETDLSLDNPEQSTDVEYNEAESSYHVFDLHWGFTTFKCDHPLTDSIDDDADDSTYATSGSDFDEIPELIEENRVEHSGDSESDSSLIEEDIEVPHLMEVPEDTDQSCIHSIQTSELATRSPTHEPYQHLMEASGDNSKSRIHSIHMSEHPTQSLTDNTYSSSIDMPDEINRPSEFHNHTNDALHSILQSRSCPTHFQGKDAIELSAQPSYLQDTEALIDEPLMCYHCSEAPAHTLHPCPMEVSDELQPLSHGSNSWSGASVSNSSENSNPQLTDTPDDLVQSWLHSLSSDGPSALNEPLNDYPRRVEPSENDEKLKYHSLGTDDYLSQFQTHNFIPQYPENVEYVSKFREDFAHDPPLTTDESLKVRSPESRIKVEPNPDEDSLPSVPNPTRQSMHDRVELLPTEVQPGSPTLPLNAKPISRLDSENIIAALADIPFLERTKSAHPFILSTAHGLLLGQSSDPIGQTHQDLLFLQAGHFDLTQTPYSVTPGSAFVRFFPALSGGPPQPWLLPYMNNPPETFLVRNLEHEKMIYIDERTNPFKDAALHPDSAAMTTGSPIITTRRGKPEPGCVSCREAPCGVCPTHNSATISTPLFPTAPTPPSSPNENSELPTYDAITRSTSATTESSITRILEERSALSKHHLSSRPPTPLPTPPLLVLPPRRLDSTEYSDRDADGDSDMDIEMTSVSEDWNAEQEWRDLKREISAEVEKNLSIAANAPKPRPGGTIYDHLFNSWLEATGLPPSDHMMDQLQNEWITWNSRQPDFDSLDEKSSLTNKWFPSLEAAKNALGIPLKKKPSPLTAKKPFIPSPLSQSAFIPHEFQSPFVFMVQETTLDDESDKKNSNIINGTSTTQPPTHNEDLQHPRSESPIPENPMPTNAHTQTECLYHNLNLDTLVPTDMPPLVIIRKDPNAEVDTVPNSPEPAFADVPRNRFKGTRKVGRERIVENLQIEIGSMKELLEVSTDFEPFEKKLWEERLKKNEERLEKYKDPKAGKIFNRCFRRPKTKRKNYLCCYAPDVNPSDFPYNEIPIIIHAWEGDDTICASNTAGNTQTTYEVPRPTSARGSNRPDPSIPQCPSYPENTKDPRLTPIAERLWLPGGENDWTKRAATATRPLFVNGRTLEISGDPKNIPADDLKCFTELGGKLQGFIFQGYAGPRIEYPEDVPDSKATNYLERAKEMQKERQDIESFFSELHNHLTPEQRLEFHNPYLTVYRRISPNSNTLVAVRIDAIYFFLRLHPTWNPYFKPPEFMFARRVWYALLGVGMADEAQKIDSLLRTPHYDDWEIRELVAIGCLETSERLDEVLEYLREVDDDHWDHHMEKGPTVKCSANSDSEEEGEVREQTNGDQPAQTLTIRLAVPFSHLSGERV